VPAARGASEGKAALLSDEVIRTVSATVGTTFQFVSTALTVTVKGVPAVWLVAVPVLPVGLPGEADSPGERSCSLAKAPALTGTAGLVLAVMAGCVTSEAVTVALPLVFKVTLKTFAPFTNAALAGRTAFASLAAIATVSFVLIRFQNASTALTVTLNGVPAVWAMGVPVLPAGEPGAAVSPGNRICIFANAPAATVIEGEVLGALLPFEMSEAVNVAVLLSVTLKVCVPATSAAFAGKLALLSVEVIPTVSVTVFTTFQFASTALTVMLNAPPET